MVQLETCPCSGGNLPRLVQPVLLALLAGEAMHGYVLVRKVMELDLFPGGVPDTTGIYRKLREMERSGVLATSPEPGRSGPARKKYMVTDLGRECLDRWLVSLGRAREHFGSVIEFVASAGARAQGEGLSSCPCPDGRSPGRGPCACADGNRTAVTTAPKAGGSLYRPENFGQGAAAGVQAGEGEGSALTCPSGAADFLARVAARALAGLPPRREDVLRILSWDPDSAEVAELGRRAREMARLVAGNRAGVWAAVGVDCAPCAMNCSFCAFGAKWGVVRGRHEWSEERILAAATGFAAEGAAWIVLRTTEHYGEERLCGLVRKVRDVLPAGCVLVANTGQLSARALTALRESGAEAVYHALRLGEGSQTPFDPLERRRALGRITGAGLALAHLVEPLGAEHGNGEIADVFLAAQAAGACVCGVMVRNSVPGTPLGDGKAPTCARLAQVVAMTRLCSGVRSPYICVHPPLPRALAWGANVVVVETGAVPRDRVEAEGEWMQFTVSQARALLQDQGYAVCDRLY